MRKVFACGFAVLVCAFAAPSALASNYVILYNQQAVTAAGSSAVTKAGGTVVQAWPQIGVVIASSNSRTFASDVARDSRVEGASATARFDVKIGADPAAADAQGPPPGDLPNSPATDTDTFSPLQWDMRQIHTPEAHVVTGGSPSVVVGDIDTGIDYRHPDLAQNIDSASSANCLSGSPVPGAAAADDDNGHGTHTAGTIAAAANGHGIVGVAPNVKLAGIKAGNADGYFFPEAVICAFMWAGNRHLDVTNNSYFADPWEYNCRNDAAQRAIWKAEQRAIRYAMNQGVTVVAAAGNDSDDLSHPTGDVTSPDYPPGSEQQREITNACVVIPVEIPGVVGVSATGSSDQGTNAGQYPDNLKSFYSSYGVSAVDVAAPGGDSRYFTPESVNGRVLSTWPAALASGCLRQREEPTDVPGYPIAYYCYQQGTSMASPHVAGIAALIVSRYGDAANPQNGKLRPGQVAALLSQTADPQACPDMLPPGYAAVLGVNSGAVQQCQGGPGHNSWYGTGQADAFNAVTHAAGNN